jgi:predicted DNA-binding transcriptional regulator AlpA
MRGSPLSAGLRNVATGVGVGDMSEPRTGKNRKIGMKEAALYTGRAVGTIRNWIANGDHPKYVKEMGRVYFWTHDIDSWLEAKQEVHEANVREWNRRAG